MSVVPFPTRVADTYTERASALLQASIYLKQAINFLTVAGAQPIADQVKISNDAIADWDPWTVPARQAPAPPEFHIIYDASVSDPGRVLGCYQTKACCDAAFDAEKARRARVHGQGSHPMAVCRTTEAVRVGTLIQDYDPVMLKELSGALHYWTVAGRTPEPFRSITSMQVVRTKGSTE